MYTFIKRAEENTWNHFVRKNSPASYLTFNQNTYKPCLHPQPHSHSHSHSYCHPRCPKPAQSPCISCSSSYSVVLSFNRPWTSRPPLSFSPLGSNSRFKFTFSFCCSRNHTPTPTHNPHTHTTHKPTTPNPQPPNLSWLQAVFRWLVLFARDKFFYTPRVWTFSYQTHSSFYQSLSNRW